MHKRILKFKQEVWNHWRKNGRHDLPWRNLPAGRQGRVDPYHILVSEIMLQQTQVDRVIPYYDRFLKKFPTIKALAKSNLADVLKLWSGLGYNRRAKMLRDCAISVAKKYKGKVPQDRASLESLPGVGPYTAGAIRAFALNEPDVFIETNIRTAFLYHFKMFHTTDGRHRDGTIKDSDILNIAERVAKGQDPRKWHLALMDYGAHLKKSGVRLNHKSAHYAKQSKFEGSLRQVRGEILRRILKGEKWEEKGKMRKALRGLYRDGLISKRDGKWQIF